MTEVQLDRKITSSELQPLFNAAYQQEVSDPASEPGRWVLRYGDIKSADTEQSNVDIQQALAPLSEVQVLNSSVVGPQIGQELAEQGGLAVSRYAVYFRLFKLSLRVATRIGRFVCAGTRRCVRTGVFYADADGV